MPDGILQQRPDFDQAKPSDPVFEQYPSCSWTVGGKTIVFPALMITEEGGNRIVNRERPYRDGAKIDDVGSKPKSWTIETLFNNTIEEGSTQNGKALYPAVLNDLVRSFDQHDTGDLVVATVGKVRARAMSYSRVERQDERDSATLELKFIQDNEDKIDATSFTLPTVRGSLQQLTEAAVFSAQSDASFSSSLADLNEFADGLVAIANFPGNTLQDVDSQAGIVVGATNRVLDAFTSKSNNPRIKARNMLSDADASITQRRLTALADTSARARADLRGNQPPIIRVVLDVPMTIFDAAIQFGQDATKLMAINSSLDMLHIPAGAVVRIYDL